MRPGQDDETEVTFVHRFRAQVQDLPDDNLWVYFSSMDPLKTAMGYLPPKAKYAVRFSITTSRKSWYFFNIRIPSFFTTFLLVW